MIIVLILFFYIFLSWLVAYTGRYRLFGFWGYFFASLLLTPLLGLLFVIASSGSDRYVVSMSRTELDSLKNSKATAKTEDKAPVSESEAVVPEAASVAARD